MRVASAVAYGSYSLICYGHVVDLLYKLFNESTTRSNDFVSFCVSVTSSCYIVVSELIELIFSIEHILH